MTSEPQFPGYGQPFTAASIRRTSRSPRETDTQSKMGRTQGGALLHVQRYDAG